jgi:hypothetical protein
MEYSMNAEQTRKLLELTAECGIPLQHTVALLFRTRRLALGAFARQAGSQRTTLYQALAGERPPSPGMRTAMTELLGVDPWTVYGMAPLPEAPGTPPPNRGLHRCEPASLSRA